MRGAPEIQRGQGKTAHARFAAEAMTDPMATRQTADQRTTTLGRMYCIGCHKCFTRDDGPGPRRVDVNADFFLRFSDSRSANWATTQLLMAIRTGPYHKNDAFCSARTAEKYHKHVPARRSVFRPPSADKVHVGFDGILALCNASGSGRQLAVRALFA